MIKIRNLNFKYDYLPVLRNLSCDISAQDFVAIIGPNGAGKTTLIKCISGFLSPHSGRIIIDGKSLGQYSKIKLAKKISVVVQQPHFEFDFTVKEIVMMGRFHHLKFYQDYQKEDREATEQTLNTLKISHLAERNISELSGGEFQLVMIARALNQNTDILIFDEPASHLDIHHQIKIFSMLKKLHLEKKKTIIAVSHNINLAAEYCHKVLLLSEGKVLDYGIVGEVLKSSNLSSIFKIPVKITKNPFTNKPIVIYNLGGAAEKVSHEHSRTNTD